MILFTRPQFRLLFFLLQTASPEILKVLQEVRKKAVIGFVGGSDLVKISEQLAVDGRPGPYRSIVFTIGSSGLKRLAR